MLKIITVPNSLLVSPVKPVVKFDSQLTKLIKAMEKILMAQKNPQGVGLATPQVGVNLAVFIIKPAPQAKTEVFINPRVIKRITNNIEHETKTKKQKRKKTKLEGCLSIPKFWAPVKRSNKILLEYQTTDGKTKSHWFTDFKAVIIQHEVDHLQGILFTQKALEQNVPLYEERDGKLEKVEY